MRHDPPCLKDLKVELDVYGKSVVSNADKWDPAYVPGEEVVDLVAKAREGWNDWSGSGYYDDTISMIDVELLLPASLDDVHEGQCEKELSG
jgi:hypothetical protein